jgi:hypothetical protein
MKSTPLRVVVENPLAAPPPASLGERIQQLQIEARRLARDHIDALGASLVETQQLADQIATGGDAYPPGVRDIARRLGEDCAAKALSIEAIMGRR